MARRVGEGGIRRGSVLAAVACLAVVGAAVGAVVNLGGGDDPGSNLSATGDGVAPSALPDTEEPTTTGGVPRPDVASPPPAVSPPSRVAAPPTTGAPVTVDGVTRTTIAEDAAKGWSLSLATTRRSWCLEFFVSTFTSGPLVCDAPPVAPGDVLGDLVMFNTPVGRAVVAVVEPAIDGWSATPYVTQQKPAVADPVDGRRAYAYAAGLLNPIGGPSNASISLWFRQGDNTVARSAVAVGEGTVSPGQSLTTKSAPYGVWPGYRVAGSTGYFWGGNEEVGFYDGPDGIRCLLYRRLGGESEAVIADVCVPRTLGRAVPYAALLPADAGMASGRTVVPDAGILVVLVDDPEVRGWRCELDTGGSCGGGSPGGGALGQVLRDPTGSGRSMLGNFPGSLSFGRATTVTIFPLGATKELPKLVLATPR